VCEPGHTGEGVQEPGQVSGPGHTLRVNTRLEALVQALRKRWRSSLAARRMWSLPCPGVLGSMWGCFGAVKADCGIGRGYRR